jgi:SulP family sulfate permease
MRFFPRYTSLAARYDLIAGLTVAAISLPQAMAYALIAGIDPRFGLYSAIVVTLVASIFGSSSHLINGPTNAISLVVFSALAFIGTDSRLDAFEAMFLLAIMIGIIQIMIAVFKLGDLTRYISESVVLGFMAGAGFLIALGQVGNFFGIKNRGTGDQHVLLRFWMTVTQAGHLNWRELTIGAGTVILVVSLRVLCNRRRLPKLDMLVALIVATVVGYAMHWSRSDAHGKTLLALVGNVPASLPRPHIPQIKFWWIRQMTGSAFAISFLGLVEALAIAKSIASHTRQPLDYNRQCMAEGLANLVGGFFQCLPGSGSLTRSAINFQSGAVSRFSGVIAASAVAVVLLIIAPLMRFVPKAALAGLLIVTAARLIDWARLRIALRASRFDAWLVVVTAASAIFISVEFSILIGVAASIVMFVPRAARLRGRELFVSSERIIRDRRPSDPTCTAMIIYDFEGELFFGAAPELDRALDRLSQRARELGMHSIILRMKRTRNPDMVCLERLQHFLRDMAAEGILVLLCGVRADFAAAMNSMRFHEWLPADRVFMEETELYSSTLKAVRHAYELSGEQTCEHCAQILIENPARELYYLV